MLYDLVSDGHPNLSARAEKELETNEAGFQATVEVAEDLLGLTGTTLQVGATGDLIKSYIVRQINLMYQMGLDPIYIKSQHSSRTAQGKTYRDTIIDPIALKGVTAILVREIRRAKPLRSLRS